MSLDKWYLAEAGLQNYGGHRPSKRGMNANLA